MRSSKAARPTNCCRPCSTASKHRGCDRGQRMRFPLIPSRAALWTVAGAAVAAVVALALQVPTATVGRVALGAVTFGIVWAVVDIGRSMMAWRRTPLVWKRRMPAALALGVSRNLACALVNEGSDDWQVELFDHVDP